MISFMPLLLYPRDKSLKPTGQEPGWTTKPAWILCTNEVPLVHYRNLNPACPVCCLVTIPTEVTWFPICLVLWSSITSIKFDKFSEKFENRDIRISWQWLLRISFFGIWCHKDGRYMFFSALNMETNTFFQETVNLNQTSRHQIPEGLMLKNDSKSLWYDFLMGVTSGETSLNN